MVYIYTHTYIRIYPKYIHTYIYAYIHAYLQKYIHTYIHTQIHTYIHIQIRTYIHCLNRSEQLGPSTHDANESEFLAGNYPYIHTFIHIYILLTYHTYIYIHTYIQAETAIISPRMTYPNLPHMSHDMDMDIPIDNDDEPV